MSIGDLARDVGRAISLLPAATVAQVVHVLTEAREVLAQATERSNDPEAHDAVGLLGEAIEALGVTYKQIVNGRQLLEHYLGEVGPVDAPRPDASRPAPQKAPTHPTRSTRLDPKRVQELQRELPPQVPKPNPESKKTHARWIDASGNVQQGVSGEDQYSEAAAELFKAAGVPPNKKLSIVTHAEVKVVAQMIEAGQQHSEVVINNRPCPGPLGCDALLAVILPEGSSLTVHGPNYRKTFTGGKKW